MNQTEHKAWIKRTRGLPFRSMFMYICPKCGSIGLPAGKHFSTVMVCWDCGHRSSSNWYKVPK